MKKTFIALMATAMIGATMFMACRKDLTTPVTSASTHQTAQKTSLIITDDPGNPNNPFDYLGALHNDLLDATRTTWKSGTATTNDMFEALVANFPGASPNLRIHKSDIINYADLVASERSTGFPSLFANSDLSSSGKVYAQSIIDLMSDLDGYATYDDYKNAVIAVENNMSSDRNLSQEDKKIIFSIASTARYSMKFWVNEVIIDQTPPDNPNNPPSIPMGLPFWKDAKKWIKEHKAEVIAVVADAASYVGSKVKDPPLSDSDASMVAALASLTAFVLAL